MHRDRASGVEDHGQGTSAPGREARCLTTYTRGAGSIPARRTSGLWTSRTWTREAHNAETAGPASRVRRCGASAGVGSWSTLGTISTGTQDLSVV